MSADPRPDLAKASDVRQGLAELDDMPLGFLNVYFARDRESGEIRAAHLRSVMRNTPAMMAVNVADVGLVLWAFWARLPAGLWAWAALVCLLSGLGLAGWRRGMDAPLPTASPRAIRRAAVHAGALGLAWGLLPVLWFADAPAQHQLLIACIVTGMIGAGGLALARLPLSSAAFVSLIALGAMLALIQVGGPIFTAVAGLLLCFVGAMVVAVAGLARQATALLRSQREATRHGQMVSLLLRDFEDNASEALWELHADGTLSHVSPRLAELLGGTPGQLSGQHLLQVLEQRDSSAASLLRHAMSANSSFRDLRLTVSLPDGQRTWAASAKRLVDEEGRARGWRGILSDVTSEAQAQDRLMHLAHSDTLTNLANRVSLHEAMRLSLSKGTTGALLALDLDHFKHINDALGHSAGDALLKAVAERLTDCVRPGDLVARLGGDEFAVLCQDSISPADAEALAKRLVKALEVPVNLLHRRVRVAASVGIAVWQPPAPTVDDLMVQADLALYEAKGAGRARYAVYTPRLGERSTRRTAIEQGLIQGLETGQFQLAWQPQINLSDWRIEGAEALLRWEHPTLGRVSPVEFVAVAEQCGQITALGTWVLQQACRAAAGPLQGLRVSVNVSPAQLMGGDFPDCVRRALLTTRIDPQQLELEITESLFMGDVPSALAQLHALRSMGVRVALDDFGTGYSSLAYLRRFPFDTLKIDRAFIDEMLQREDARTIVHMMTQLATNLGMRTVAEGVETQAQLAAVAAAGCDEVQGYVVSQPLTLEALVELRNGWLRNRASGIGEPRSA